MQRLIYGKYVPLVVATLIGVIIVAQALALQRSYQATWLLAGRSAENVLNAIATTIGRNLSVIDLSLRGAEEAARAQGRSGGRQSKLSPHQQAEVITMLTAGRSTADIARLFRVHRATISRIVNNLAVKDAVPAP
ncbi:helix-turn-helix domain-containing protein [Xanthobacter versatilis]|uniref:helix-turn-helix domain-containing protein n=1 Tax=Xanthobacter autotrophicus (strain ATCC BAA-1158 / Py2) TaxID=78245 RepID=UPI0037289061